ncbi:hypothetical protein B2G71_10830 [Novosphingobium sp. PC22D]|uniref:DUF4230 domain-containing protein n=1 Tax=Novosphingobium sp. PC22D TaxID=1962403 RepID=UPI000BF14C5F|nr:DUF4230 domain-containing protein [Novosphingobium sp. PC22D]PEQ12781.1 hypothetical protein B2G71_10830 [Novosphingobium sp. PC22D]
MTDETPPQKAPKQHALARTQGVPWLLFVLVLAVAGWLAYAAYWPQERGDPSATGLLAFEKQNKLTVFSAQLAPLVTAEDSRFMGLVESRQAAVIPARVDYTLDLSAMDRSRMNWNPEDKTLEVLLPPLKVGKPNLDEAQAKYLREGLWISREAQDKMNRETTRKAQGEAVKQASAPALVAVARSAAKDAVRQNLAIPLQVAGFGDVTVLPRFEGEPSPAAEKGA